MRSLSKLTLCLIAIVVTPVKAVDLNYETLSSLEEPLAVHMGDTTLRLGGLLDAPVIFDLEGDADTRTELFGNFQLDLETQLDNSWTVGAAYFGSYSTIPDSDNYDDNYALYVSGVWGTLLAGNVSGQVLNFTGRGDGVGNINLAFDQPIGNLEDDGIAYIGRYGPSRISAVIDSESNFDLGWEYRRPLGNKDYRFSLFYRNTSDNFIGATSFDSQAITGLAELTYGSNVFDIRIGGEQLNFLDRNRDRNFVSAGFRKKIGVWSFSLQGLYGEMEQETQRSVALGMAYDLARGLSLNLGLNHLDSEISMNGEQLVGNEVSVGILSLRYSF